MHKLKNYRKKKKAVSTVLAVLLMIAVAVAGFACSLRMVNGILKLHNRKNRQGNDDTKRWT